MVEEFLTPKRDKISSSWFLAFMIDWNSNAVINSCDNCDHAWLYKDAKQFGFEAYKRLVGNNAICPGVGPILETDDVDFIAQMNDCPCKLNIFYLLHKSYFIRIINKSYFIRIINPFLF